MRKTDDKKSKISASKKGGLHPRNKHDGRYDFSKLKEACAELIPFIISNEKGEESIDFFNSDAVTMLNRALLKQYYQIENWEIPKGYLCPPVPGRADYIHHVADLLKNNNFGKIPTGNKVTCIDVGIGANMVYPLIGISEYGWKFIGLDIDKKALESAQSIADANHGIKENLELRLQKNPLRIFHKVLKTNERFDITICNPPFHSSEEEAAKANMRKLKNLKKIAVTKPELNFQGVNNELWCEGGELRFIQDMIAQSRDFATQCFWFTTLVSKQSNVRAIHKLLRVAKATGVETIEMGQGNKSSRIIAWTFLPRKEQHAWKMERWH